MSRNKIVKLFSRSAKWWLWIVVSTCSTGCKYVITLYNSISLTLPSNWEAFQRQACLWSLAVTHSPASTSNSFDYLDPHSWHWPLSRNSIHSSTRFKERQPRYQTEPVKSRILNTLILCPNLFRIINMSQKLSLEGNFPRNPHRIKNRLRLNENIINLLQRAALSLRTEKIKKDKRESTNTSVYNIIPPLNSSKSNRRHFRQKEIEEPICRGGHSGDFGASA